MKVPQTTLVRLVAAGCLLLTAREVIVGSQTQALQLAAGYPTLQGIVQKVEVGNDHLKFWVYANGRTFTFFQGASTDNLPPGYSQYGPKGHPSILDVGSQASVMYSGGSYLEYRVLSRPQHLWIVIAASQPMSAGDPSSHMQELKHAWYDRGCMADILDSSDSPALKSGYWIVVSGGFLNPTQADGCRRKAVAMGVSDSYIRKLW